MKKYTQAKQFLAVDTAFSVQETMLVLYYPNRANFLYLVMMKNGFGRKKQSGIALPSKDISNAMIH